MDSISDIWTDTIKQSRKLTSTNSTQTNGLYFPSAAELKKSGRDTQQCKDLEREYRARAALLTPISPGKGMHGFVLRLHLKSLKSAMLVNFVPGVHNLIKLRMTQHIKISKRKTRVPEHLGLLGVTDGREEVVYNHWNLAEDIFLRF